LEGFLVVPQLAFDFLDACRRRGFNGRCVRVLDISIGRRCLFPRRKTFASRRSIGIEGLPLGWWLLRIQGLSGAASGLWSLLLLKGRRRRRVFSWWWLRRSGGTCRPSGVVLVVAAAIHRSRVLLIAGKSITTIGLGGAWFF
jgi:hypothetical protein